MRRTRPRSRRFLRQGFRVLPKPSPITIPFSMSTSSTGTQASSHRFSTTTGQSIPPRPDSHSEKNLFPNPSIILIHVFMSSFACSVRLTVCILLYSFGQSIDKLPSNISWERPAIHGMGANVVDKDDRYT